MRSELCASVCRAAAVDQRGFPPQLVLWAVTSVLRACKFSLLSELPSRPFQSWREAQLISIFWDAECVWIEGMTTCIKLYVFSSVSAFLWISSAVGNIKSQHFGVLCKHDVHTFLWHSDPHPTLYTKAKKKFFFKKKLRKMGCSILGTFWKSYDVDCTK